MMCLEPLQLSCRRVRAAECRASGGVAVHLLAVLCVLLAWCVSLSSARTCVLCSNPSSLPAACHASTLDPRAVINAKCPAVCGHLNFTNTNTPYSLTFPNLLCIEGELNFKDVPNGPLIEFLVLNRMQAVRITGCPDLMVQLDSNVWIDGEVVVQESSGGLVGQSDVIAGSVTVMSCSAAFSLTVSNCLTTNNGGVTLMNLNPFYLSVLYMTLQGPFVMQNVTMDFWTVKEFKLAGSFYVENSSGMYGLGGTPPVRVATKFTIKNSDLNRDWTPIFTNGPADVWVDSEASMAVMNVTLDNPSYVKQSKIVAMNNPLFYSLDCSSYGVGQIYLKDNPQLSSVECTVVNTTKTLSVPPVEDRLD